MSGFIKKFWENCNTNFAHIEISGHLKNLASLRKFWKDSFINRIDFSNKVVAEYGIGGGYLGELLFEEYDIKKYHGIDISERSLKESNKRLSKFHRYNLMNSDFYYNSFSEEIDVFVSQAVIQHFPDKKYLDNFLYKLKSLSPQTIMLQIAHKKENLFVKNNNYKSTKDVVRACYTNSKYINSILDYSITFESDVHKKNNYQFIIFEKCKK